MRFLSRKETGSRREQFWLHWMTGMPGSRWKNGSVVDPVRCAVVIQKELKNRNARLPENRRMEFRIGVNLGDVVEVHI